MKKLVSIFALAAIAGAGFAAVDSQNTVGYQDMASATFKLITPTFTQVGGGTAFTLADLVPASIDDWDPGSDKILLYTGAMYDYSATYLNADIVADIVDNFPELAGIEAGWFDYDDFSNLGNDVTATLKCYSSRVVNYGSSGFAIEASNSLRFVGEVKATATQVANATFKLVGNCSPVDLTLGQILPADVDSWDPGSDKLLFFTGAMYDYSATYLNADIVADIVDNFPELAGIQAGWFDYDDFSNLGNEETATLKCYSSRSIPAGSGFAIEANNAIAIPAPENL